MKNFNNHIILRGVLFDIDFDACMLSEHTNSANNVVLDYRLAEKGFYLVDVDPWKDNKIQQFAANHHAYDPIRIPVHLLDKDYNNSFAMAESINQSSRIEGWHFLVPDKLIFQRLNDELPQMRIGEDLFNYDGEKELIIPMDGLSPAMRLVEFTKIDDDEIDAYEAYYHIPSRKVVQIDMGKITEWPKDVVYLSIPGPDSADPVGVARKYGQPELQYLSRLEKYDHYKAELKDVSFRYHETMFKNKLKQTNQKPESIRLSVKKPKRSMG